MKHANVLVTFIVVILSLPASAQITKSLEDCERTLGRPTKVHRTSPPSRLYMHDGLHVQVSYQGGRATAIVYRLVGQFGSLKLSDERINKIYKLNRIDSEDIVDINFPELLQLREVYKMTKDGETIILNDRTKNVFAIYHADSIIRHLRKGH